MPAAERGFRRLDAALDRIGPEPLTQILRSLKLQSIDRLDNLQTLRQIVLALEAAARGESSETVDLFGEENMASTCRALPHRSHQCNQVALRRSIVSDIERKSHGNSHQTQNKCLTPEEAAAELAILAGYDRLAEAEISFVAVHLDGSSD